MPQGVKRLPQPHVDFHDFHVHLFPDLSAIIAHMGALEYGAFGELLVAHPRLYQTRP